MREMPPVHGESILGTNLECYFNGLLAEAVGEKNFQVSPIALDYVAKVMVGFMASENFFRADGGRLPVLADYLAEALEADACRRISILKRLGDTSLMLSGYFKDAVTKRSVDISYYYQMGETAYSHLRGMVEVDNVFSELSEAFRDFSGLVEDVSTKIRYSHLGPFELLNAYKDSKSDAALEQLKKHGVIPIKSSDES